MDAGCLTSLIHKPVVDSVMKLGGKYLERNMKSMWLSLVAMFLWLIFTGSGSQGAMTSLLPLDPLLLTMTTWCTGCGPRMSYFFDSQSEYMVYRVWNQDVSLFWFSHSKYKVYRVWNQYVLLPSFTQWIHDVQGVEPGCLTSLIHTVNTRCTGCGTRMSHFSDSHTVNTWCTGCGTMMSYFSG